MGCKKREAAMLLNGHSLCTSQHSESGRRVSATLHVESRAELRKPSRPAVLDATVPA